MDESETFEMCARIAETLHGVDEGDTVKDVAAGRRIAKAIRDVASQRLKRARSSTG